MNPSKKRKRTLMQCTACERKFNDDYGNKHFEKYHGGKKMKLIVAGAPANPFVAAQRANPSSSSKCDTTESSGSSQTFYEEKEEHSVSEIPDASAEACSSLGEDNIKKISDAEPSEMPPHIPLENPPEQPQESSTESTTTSDEYTTVLSAILPEVENPRDPIFLPPGKLNDDIRTTLCFHGAFQPRCDSMPGKVFPETDGRKFHEEWYTRNSGSSEELERCWLEYSISGDRMYCFACRLFAKENDKNYETNWCIEGMKNWKKATEKINAHEKCKIHLQSVIDWTLFMSGKGIEKGISNMHKRTYSEQSKRIEENRAVLKRLLDIIMFLAKQNLALRGHDESENSDNKGNFLELVELVAKYDQVLYKHLSQSKEKEKYLSATIQNDFIEALRSVVNDSIINDVMKSGVFSVIIDETTDAAHREQVSFTLRFCQEGEIYETFLKFSSVERTTAESLQKELLDFLEENGLNVMNIRGQGYV